eukprot:scaffold69_cov248-Pinguiococcus_pyrenoidosus.AAC.20
MTSRVFRTLPLSVEPPRNPRCLQVRQQHVLSSPRLHKSFVDIVNCDHDVGVQFQRVRHRKWPIQGRRDRRQRLLHLGRDALGATAERHSGKRSVPWKPCVLSSPANRSICRIFERCLSHAGRLLGTKSSPALASRCLPRLRRLFCAIVEAFSTSARVWIVFQSIGRCATR